MGISHPQIGIAGLNPHASDNGLFGDEERNEIIPAIEELRLKGYDVEGPIPPDTLFAKANVENTTDVWPCTTTKGIFHLRS